MAFEIFTRISFKNLLQAYEDIKNQNTEIDFGIRNVQHYTTSRTSMGHLYFYSMCIFKHKCTIYTKYIP